MRRFTFPLGVVQGVIRHIGKSLAATSRLPNKSAMIYTLSVCVMWPNYRGANVVGAPLKFRKRKEN